MGADNLLNMHRWKNWRKIPKLAKIVIFPRENYSFTSIATKKLSKNDFIRQIGKKLNFKSNLIYKKLGKNIDLKLTSGKDRKKIRNKNKFTIFRNFNIIL